MGGAALGLLAPSSLTAQEIAPAVPILDIPEDEFVPTRINIGGASVILGGTVRTEYDDNIYARAFNKVDDTKLIFQPFVSIADTGQRIEFTAKAEGNFRKYLKHDTESANGGSVSTNTTWHLTANDAMTLQGGWQHAIEDRGEPEARTVTSVGPRESNIYTSDLSYVHQGARIGFVLRGALDTFRYIDQVDRPRNLTDYGLLARVSHRVTPTASGFVESFLNKRDFQFDDRGATRDSNTFGGRVGIAFDPGGVLRGDAAVGVYHFDPRASQIQARTGLSAQIGLIYQFRPRLAFTLDGFVGNVATYTSGAQSRQDTRITFGIQQEIRHNLRLQASFIYRRSRYYGTGIVQDIYGGYGELEYIINQRLMISADVRYSNRDSTAPLQKYKRLRTGIALRFHD